MCSTPSAPDYTPPAQVQQEQVAAPTYADASVTKASSSTRNKTAALAGRDIKTTARGLGDETETQKKTLLGD